MSYPRYLKYKASGVEWLGEVPGGWSVKPLCALFRRVKRTDRADEQLLSVYRDLGVVPKASRDDNFNKPSEDLSQYQLVEPGDLVINKMKAWQGSVAISDCRGIVSPAYFTYITTHRECGRYLHYLMRSLPYIACYQTISKGIRINQWDLEPEAHRRTPLLLPPLAEQRAIAAFLDRETKKIDGLVAEQERLIELLKEKRQAVISHAVTKGLDPAAPMKPSGVEWLGDVPAHWEVKRMKTLGAVRYGIGEPPKYRDEGTALIRATNVHAGRVNASGMVFVNPADIPTQRIVWLRPGDIIVVRSGAYTGDSAIIPHEYDGAIAGFDMVLRCASDVQPNFVQYGLLGASLLAQLELASTRAAQPHLNAEELGSCLLVLPPGVEQRAIAACLDRETKKVDDLVAQAESAMALLTERRSALISAAVTGQIDVRNAVPSATPTEAA
jgi:type I restriction enzyme S subunit